MATWPQTLGAYHSTASSLAGKYDIDQGFFRREWVLSTTKPAPALSHSITYDSQDEDSVSILRTPQTGGLAEPFEDLLSHL